MNSPIDFRINGYNDHEIRWDMVKAMIERADRFNQPSRPVTVHIFTDKPERDGMTHYQMNICDTLSRDHALIIRIGCVSRAANPTELEFHS